MNEYFLITWESSGDETHFMLLPMSEFAYINGMVAKLAGRKIPHKEVDKFIGETYEKAVKTFFTQTYCTEDWPFGEYNIKKLISLPEFGW